MVWGFIVASGGCPQWVESGLSRMPAFDPLLPFASGGITARSSHSPRAVFGLKMAIQICVPTARACRSGHSQLLEQPLFELSYSVRLRGSTRMYQVMAHVPNTVAYIAQWTDQATAGQLLFRYQI